MSDMFEKDKNVIALALSMWANHIETGNVSLSQADAIMIGRAEVVIALTLEQQKFVVRLRDLSNKHLFGEAGGDIQ
jgi:hypothetical protein